MAAFTTFQPESLERYLVMFGRGTLAGFEPIEGGIENSNYFLTLDKDGEQTEYDIHYLLR
jgi:homoserine kinase type II